MGFRALIPISKVFCPHVLPIFFRYGALVKIGSLSHEGFHSIWGWDLFVFIIDTISYKHILEVDLG